MGKTELTVQYWGTANQAQITSLEQPCVHRRQPRELFDITFGWISIAEKPSSPIVMLPLCPRNHCSAAAAPSSHRPLPSFLSGCHLRPGVPQKVPPQALGTYKGQKSCHQKDADEKVFKLLQHQLPEGLSWWENMKPSRQCSKKYLQKTGRPLSPQDPQSHIPACCRARGIGEDTWHCSGGFSLK